MEMLPQYYEFYNPVKIIAGNKALESIPYELNLLNAERPLIITDKGIVEAGLLKILVKAFRDSDIVIGAIYDDTPADSSIEVVNEIPRVYHDNRCDSLIAIGGGSVIDTAKGANIVI
jgi:alcohol dehydrogenase